MAAAAGAALPPLILLGGAAGNALSVARSVGRQGVRVYLLADGPEVFSRYMRRIALPPATSPQSAWVRFLLGPDSEHLRSAVLLACSDAGIEVLADHRAELSAKFVLDISDPTAQRCLLNKLSTYEKAAEAGVPAPRFWRAESAEQVVAHADEYVYPLLVKPVFSHKFQAVFGAKFFRVAGLDELVAAFEAARRHDLEVVLLEEIPGPDDHLCSYYTYIDESGAALCDFTKRIIRRFPVGEGLACYHVTDWEPDVRELGLRLFRHVGLRGLGNIEFKRDDRDGKLKVIECNARFTAANALLVASGCDLGLFVYGRLAGLPVRLPQPGAYARGLHLWSPGRDLRAFLTLNSRGELSLPVWLASLAHRQVLPYFRWYDPVPAIAGTVRFATHAAGVALRRGRARGRDATRGGPAPGKAT